MALILQGGAVLTANANNDFLPTADIRIEGAEIAAIVMEECFDWLDAPVKRVTGKDVPLPYAANLERLALPQVEDIVAAARELAYR